MPVHTSTHAHDTIYEESKLSNLEAGLSIELSVMLSKCLNIGVDSKNLMEIKSPL